MKKLTLITILFIFYLPATAYCQGDSTRLKEVVSKLNAALTSNITEKAYLQFDKPYYAAGDTIYFKAYVTTGEHHLLSNLSGVLHVDLINANNKIDQSIKLQLDSGVAWGDFALPDSLPAGNYHIRAYTRWMKNNPDSFFDKVIPFGSITSKAVVYENASPSNRIPQQQADLQFFPEGGYFVQGIRSKIAFKAVAADGKGMAVKGIITDNYNAEVGRFESAHLGIGFFYLLPEEGKTYKAILSFADGTQSTVDLPKAEEKGMVLAVDNQSAEIFLAGIFANKKYYDENKGKTLSLVIYSGGSTRMVNAKLDNPELILRLPKSEFKTGIAQITLFSAGGEPLNERLAFIQNNDLLNLTVKSDKPSYKKREGVKISLNSAGAENKPAEGHFSVSIIDEGKVPADENEETTILSYLLLTSDLKGTIEQPNYYFTDTSANASKNLDVLMLTQGYRRFTWKQVLDNSYLLMAYQPEKGIEIAGQIKNPFGKPITKGTITLIPSKGGRLLTSVSDSKGMFHFADLVFTDTTHFVLSAVNAKGSNLTQITYFNDKPEPVTTVKPVRSLQTVKDTSMATYLENTKNNRNELINSGRGKGILLKEVKIKNTKIEPLKMGRYGVVDQVIPGSEILYGSQLTIRLMGKLHGIHFVDVGGNHFKPILNRPHDHPILIVVDGSEMPDDFDIGSINTGAVESVDVITNATAGDSFHDGAIIITTTYGLQPKDMISTGILPIIAKGFYKAREFYSPKYDNTAWVGKQQDLRSTIYWKPEIQTDKDGNASFDYYNADGTGSYKIVVEGIDNKGHIGRQVYRYKVE